MDITKLLEYDNHELVAFLNDDKTGLRGFIAIHNTNLGPANGGTRYWYYSSYEEALRDALKLSRAMTYKCALAKVPYGGGKGVIMANKRRGKTASLIRSYAKRVNLFGGRFHTGEDVGIEPKDIRIMSQVSPYIVGRPHQAGELAPWTALGIVSAIQAALEVVYGSPEIGGRTFAIKGLGKIGRELCKLLYRQGGIITASDIDQRAVKIAKRKFSKIKIVPPAEILYQKVDVLCPCALDGDLNSKSIPQLRCSIICGGANNQLASREDGERLHKRGIVYVPDYLANAGGLINVVGELRKEGYSRDWVLKKTLGIKATTKQILKISQKQNLSTSEVADRLAEEIFKKKAPKSRKIKISKKSILKKK